MKDIFISWLEQSKLQIYNPVFYEISTIDLEFVVICDVNETRTIWFSFPALLSVGQNIHPL